MRTEKQKILSKLLDGHLGLPDQPEQYSYEDAIRLVRFAISLTPREPFLYFYMAVFYSALKEINKSLFYYEEALKRGYRDWDRINTDESFQHARNTEKFKRISAKYQ